MVRDAPLFPDLGGAATCAYIEGMLREDFSVVREPGFWVAMGLALAPLFISWAVIWWVQQ